MSNRPQQHWGHLSSSQPRVHIASNAPSTLLTLHRRRRAAAALHPLLHRVNEAQSQQQRCHNKPQRQQHVRITSNTSSTPPAPSGTSNTSSKRSRIQLPNGLTKSNKIGHVSSVSLLLRDGALFYNLFGTGELLNDMYAREIHNPHIFYPFYFAYKHQ